MEFILIFWQIIWIYPNLRKRKFGGKPAWLADVRRYYKFLEYTNFLDKKMSLLAKAIILSKKVVIRTTVRNNRSSLWRDKNVNSKGPFRVAGRSYNFQNI